MAGCGRSAAVNRERPVSRQNRANQTGSEPKGSFPVCVSDGFAVDRSRPIAALFPILRALGHACLRKWRTTDCELRNQKTNAGCDDLEGCNRWPAFERRTSEWFLLVLQKLRRRTKARTPGTVYLLILRQKRRAAGSRQVDLAVRAVFSASHF
jgi:hypothetical protein